MRTPMMLALTLLLPVAALGQVPKGAPDAATRAEAPRAEAQVNHGQDLMSLVQRWQQAKKAGDASALSAAEAALMQFTPRSRGGGDGRVGPPAGDMKTAGHGKAGGPAVRGGAAGKGASAGSMAAGPAKAQAPQVGHNAVPIAGATQGGGAQPASSRVMGIRTQLQAMEGKAQLTAEEQGKQQALQRELAELTSQGGSESAPPEGTLGKPVMQGQGPDRTQARR